MSRTIVSRNISQTAKLGHRLIKFRYGPHRNQQPIAGSPQAAASHSGLKAGQQSSQQAIWDFEIPARWRRAPISEEECAIINNGGPL